MAVLELAHVADLSFMVGLVNLSCDIVMPIESTFVLLMENLACCYPAIRMEGLKEAHDKHAPIHQAKSLVDIQLKDRLGNRYACAGHVAEVDIARFEYLGIVLGMRHLTDLLPWI